MNQRECQQERTYITEAGQRASGVILELATKLQEAQERILVLETIVRDREAEIAFLQSQD